MERRRQRLGGASPCAFSKIVSRNSIPLALSRRGQNDAGVGFAPGSLAKRPLPANRRGQHSGEICSQSTGSARAAAATQRVRAMLLHLHM